MLPPQLPAPLLLASTSKYRIAQLQRLGLSFEAIAPDYDELPVLGLSAEQLVGHHAREKVRAVSQRPQFAQAWILGADQGVILDSELLGKPLTEDRAVAQLLRLAGRTHLLRTVVVLQAGGGPLLEQTVDIAMTLLPLTEAQAHSYVQRDQPLDCCGSYRIEASAPWILQSATGSDPTAIEGLPLLAVTALLRAGLARHRA